jgi:hypothetical protein
VPQVDYVRVDQQRTGLQQVQQHATALAVALPGSEGRSLHARGQDAVRLQKLAEKLGALMTKLDIEEPLQPSSSEYKEGLAALRDEQLRSLQADIEKNVSALAVLTHQRQQQGAASSITRSQRKQAQNKRKRVRQLVAMIQSWQVVDAPSSAAVERLPAAWTDSEVTQLFKGEYPWRLTSTDSSSAVAAVLAERFRDVCAEVSAGCDVQGNLHAGAVFVWGVYSLVVSCWMTACSSVGLFALLQIKLSSDDVPCGVRAESRPLVVCLKVGRSGAHLAPVS